MSENNLKTEIEALEKELLEKAGKLADLKKQMPREEVKDYNLTDCEGNSVNLFSLFGEKDDLIVIHNMGKSCPYCTLWADGFNGMVHHFENRAGFALVAPDDHETQKQFADSRGWKFKMLSAKDSRFTFDLGFQNEEYIMPGFSTFRKENGKIYRIASSFFGPGDLFCSIWHMVGLLADGAEEWHPQFEY